MGKHRISYKFFFFVFFTSISKYFERVSSVENITAKVSVWGLHHIKYGPIRSNPQKIILYVYIYGTFFKEVGMIFFTCLWYESNCYSTNPKNFMKIFQRINSSKICSSKIFSWILSFFWCLYIFWYFNIRFDISSVIFFSKWQKNTQLG